MQKTLKFINIFLFALIITLILQLILPKPEQQTTVTASGVSMSLASSSIVIPNLPQITVHNNTAESLTLHPCQDIEWRLHSQILTGFGTGKTAAYCEPFTVAPNTKHQMDLSALASVFSAQPGTYIVSISSLEGGAPMVTFTTERPGFFRSLLSGLIYEPIYNLFVAILLVLPGHSLGWAIIIITLIIRLILLVPQHKMLENSAKMNRINPKIQALRKEYKDNQAELGMKMMELYKKEGVSVGGSCLPLLIQMPILLGLYWVISGIADPSNFYHLYPFFQGFDPASINTEFLGVNLSALGGVIGLVVAGVLGVTQWLQAYLSFQYNPVKKAPEKKKTTSDAPEPPVMDPQMMQKMMLYFLPAMLAVTAYFLPYGVGLYWFIGTLFVIGQQAYVHRANAKKKTQ